MWVTTCPRCLDTSREVMIPMGACNITNVWTYCGRWSRPEAADIVITGILMELGLKQNVESPIYTISAVSAVFHDMTNSITETSKVGVQVA